MFYFFVAFVFVVWAGPVWAEEAPDLSVEAAQAAINATRETKTVEGHHFVVASDRPIEKTGGVYRPVDMDAYVAVKTRRLEEAMDERLRSLEMRLEILAEKVANLEALLRDRATDEDGFKPPAKTRVLLP